MHKMGDFGVKKIHECFETIKYRRLFSFNVNLCARIMTKLTVFFSKFTILILISEYSEDYLMIPLAHIFIVIIFCISFFTLLRVSDMRNFTNI